MHEVVRWASALVTLVGFGLAMGLNPALYGATADILARNVKPAARLRWMLSGLAVGATLLVLIFLSFDPRHYVAAFRGTFDSALVDRTVDLLAAIGFFVLAVVVLWWKMRTPTLPTKPEKVPKHGASSFSYFFIGLGACIGFTTLPIAYLTGRLISGLTTDPVIRPLTYGVFLVALAAPFLILVWAWHRVPTLTGRITGFYTRALAWDYRRELTALLAITGLVFLGLALFAHRAV